MPGTELRAPLRHRLARAGLAAAVATAVAALASCGGEPPSIAAIDWRLESRPSKSGRYESLSAFASIKDDDGAEDIAQLWIVNDAEAVAWSVTDADWIKKKEGADDWIGSAGLALSDYAALPRGEYRFVAADAAGERFEKTFRVEGAFPERAAPEMTVAGGAVAAKTTWPETLILGFDGTGALIGTAPYPAKQASLADLFGAETAGRVQYVAAYGYEPTLKMGAYSWKVKAR